MDGRGGNFLNCRPSLHLAILCSSFFPAVHPMALQPRAVVLERFSAGWREDPLRKSFSTYHYFSTVTWRAKGGKSWRWKPKSDIGYGSPRDQTAHLATSSCAMQIFFDILMFIGCLENQNGTINLPYHLGIHDNFHGSKSLSLAGMAPQNHIVRKTTIFAVQCLFGQSIPRWLVANQPQSEYLSW